MTATGTEASCNFCDATGELWLRCRIPSESCHSWCAFRKSLPCNKQSTWPAVRPCHMPSDAWLELKGIYMEPPKEDWRRPRCWTAQSWTGLNYGNSSRAVMPWVGWFWSPILHRYARADKELLKQCGCNVGLYWTPARIHVVRPLC